MASLNPTTVLPASEEEEEDAYTLFDAGDQSLSSLSTERIEGLREDPGVLPGAFRIRVARSSDSREDATALMKRRYASRGYEVQHARPDPRLFTFVAYNNGSLVGTVSLRIDSYAGLAADDLYKTEIDALRSSGGPLCEFTRLAVDMNSGSKHVLAGLFHTAFLFGYRVRSFHSAVIEVNPRHVVFYKKALGFEAHGPERLNARVNAPAVLLSIPFRTIAAGIAEYGGRPELAKSTRLLYPYAFSPKDEEGILGRLQAYNSAAEA